MHSNWLGSGEPEQLSVNKSFTGLGGGSPLKFSGCVIISWSNTDLTSKPSAFSSRCSRLHLYKARMQSRLNRVWLLLTRELQPARLLCPWDSPGKSTGVGAMPSSRGSSWPRAGTRTSYVSCIYRRVLSLPLVPPGKPFVHGHILL